MTKNKKLTRLTIAMISGVYVATISLISASCGHFTELESEPIMHAKSLIWSLPDSSKLILEEMDTVLLREEDKKLWHLLHEHTLQRLNQIEVPNPELMEIAEYFHQNRQLGYACWAHYVYGIECLFTNNTEGAIRHLKEAESLIPYLDKDTPLTGLIYYGEGYTYESEQLYHISNQYYRQALPHILSLNDTRRTAMCYRDIARTALTEPDDTVISYYHKAEEYAKICGDTLLYLDISLQRLSNILPMDSDSVLLFSQFLADTFHLTQYAAFAAEYWLIHNYSDKAVHYMQLLAGDTLLYVWNKEQYEALYSRYMADCNEYKEAYTRLRKVYENQSRQIQTDTKVRTYAIARQYDLEREQEKTLRLTIERQRLWIMTAMSFVLVMLIVGIASGIILRQRHRTEVIRRQKEKAEMERYRETAERRKAEAERQEALAREETKAAKIRILEQKQEMARTHLENLRNTLSGQQEQLRKLFVERVQFIAKLKQERDIHHRPMPEWLAKELDRRTLTNPEEWKRFEDAFKTIFGNILFELPSRYPKLTIEDLRFLTLYIVGLDNESIGILMQQELRTLWNRKQKIKDRIKENDLDGWIEKEVIETVIRRQMEEK